MNKEFNLIEAIRVILKWKVQIIVLTVVAAIAAAVFSMFVMDEYFYSWSTFYPTNQSMTDRSNIFNGDAQQLEYYGGKADVNRILTIANSVPVIQSVIDSFRLASHYDVDTNKKYWRTIVRKKFEKNYTAIKTEHDAVEISVYDTDPATAAAIVNTIVSKIDYLNKEHIRQTKQKVHDLINKQIGELQIDVIGFNDTLAELGEQYKIKVSQTTDGAVIVDGADYRAVQLYKSIMTKQTGTARELNNLIVMRGQMEVVLENNESSLYVLEPAFAADRRTKPVRSLVVIVTMFITFFVSIIGVLLIEQIREIKQQL